MACLGTSVTERRHGYRGYIGARPLAGSRIPQAVQNMVIRDYAKRNDLHYLLSATEYIMPNCYMALNEVMSELPKIEGVICYSLFMLPHSAERRKLIYSRFIECGAALHAAIEAQTMQCAEDIERWEQIWLVQQAVSPMPPAV